MARIRTDHPARRLLSLLLALLMLASLAPAALAEDTPSAEAAQAAQTLYDLGLFKGTGTNPDGTPIFALEKTPTRNQALIMLIRLLGKEDEALNGSWSIPFTDVSEGMTPYVGYAYTNGLTAGTTATTFGGSKTIKANQYVTFLLRALGYTSGEDFTVSQALDFSDSLCLTFGEYTPASTFTRGDVAILSLRALSQNLKAGSSTLANRLNLSVPPLQPTLESMLKGYWYHVHYFQPAEGSDVPGDNVKSEDIYYFCGDQMTYVSMWHDADTGELLMSMWWEGTFSLVTDDDGISYVEMNCTKVYDVSPYEGQNATELSDDTPFESRTQVALNPDDNSGKTLKLDAYFNEICKRIPDGKQRLQAAKEELLSRYDPNAPTKEEISAQYAYLAQSDFRAIKRQYSSAVGQYAYVYAFTNMEGKACVMTVVCYKIISNYFETTLHILDSGRVIHDPTDYYYKQADGLYGKSKIYAMDVAGEIANIEIEIYKASSKHLQGNKDTFGGYFLSKAELNK